MLGKEHFTVLVEIVIYSFPVFEKSQAYIRQYILIVVYCIRAEIKEIPLHPNIYKMIIYSLISWYNYAYKCSSCNQSSNCNTIHYMMLPNTKYCVGPGSKYHCWPMTDLYNSNFPQQLHIEPTGFCQYIKHWGVQPHCNPIWNSVNNLLVLQNFTIARKSGNILFTYWKHFFRPTLVRVWNVG